MWCSDVDHYSLFWTCEAVEEIVEESRRARLEGRTGQYRKLKRQAVSAMRRTKKRKSVESARQWKAICGQLTLELPTEESGRCVPQTPAPLFYSEGADGTTLTKEPEFRARWAGYFEELYRMDHSAASSRGS